MNHTKTEEKIQKEFDKIFYDGVPLEYRRDYARTMGHIMKMTVNLEEVKSFLLSSLRQQRKEVLEEVIEIIEKICDEKTMPRIWNLDKDVIDKFIKTLPIYEPKPGEEYQVGFVRGETWGALKIKLEALKILEELK